MTRKRPWTPVRIAAAITASMIVGLIACHFPFATDDPIRREDAVKEFYELAYSSAVMKDTELARQAQKAKTTYNIRGGVESFVRSFKLEGAAVLDVGSGSGYLQDVVEDYTGLDISSAVAKHYHKPFVAGTATAMPFADNEFDAAWSIWVIEHIPNPEAALAEIRRVVKPNGLLYLQPAWDCKPWAAQGYEARPYSDFGIGGKIVKATIPIRASYPFWFVSTVPSRILRGIAPRPTRLHYRRLEPNYSEYWQADSDAVNSLDSVEMAMWFESRGDMCLNCFPRMLRYLQGDRPLVIRINPQK